MNKQDFRKGKIAYFTNLKHLQFIATFCKGVKRFHFR